jgi:cyclic pyranopterin phosphate synthase
LRRFSMVDISPKQTVTREAVAVGEIKLRPGTVSRLKSGRIQKGDAIAAAEVAAVMAAKNTPRILPFCHSIPLTTIRVDHAFGKNFLRVTSHVKGQAKTGVEMEALTAVSVALLNIWDVVKPYEKDEMGQYRDTVIEFIRVTRKVKKPIGA